MEKTRLFRQLSIGDAAVEGLLNGILAGILMSVIVVGFEAVAGANPVAVLTYFSVSADASPLLGLFTHVAISGIYGVVFGIAATFVARSLGARLTMGVWLVMGIVYGLLILGIAEGVVLPNTNSPLRELPLWAFGAAHLIYGIALAGLTQRGK